MPITTVETIAQPLRMRIRTMGWCWNNIAAAAGFRVRGLLLALATSCLALMFCASPFGETVAQELPASTQFGGGELPLSRFSVWNRFRPRLEFHQQIGETIGLRDDLTRLGAFVPFSRPNSDWLMFTDLHGLFTDDGALGGNVGVGIRYADPGSDTVLGLSCHYDYRDTSVNEFQQVSPGVEVLGPGWELRANGYLPRAFESRKPAPNLFAGNFLLIDRFESAMSGFDVEFGLHLHPNGWTQPRLYGGAYHFQTPQRPQVWGWSSRLEADMLDGVSMGLSVRNDRLFDTTVNFGLTIRFSGGALLDRNPLDRVVDSIDAYPRRKNRDVQLASTPRRLRSIVLDQSEQSLAVDPVTGDPLMFLHVAAGGNSDGSFNDPYATLTDALADLRYQSGEISTIYVRGGGRQTVTHTGDFSLVDGTSVLSAGPMQMVATRSGVRQLPHSGADQNMSALPVIRSDVTMAEDSMLSGFEIQANQDGITATSISGFMISENVIRAAPRHGIRLSQINGTGMVIGNRIDDSVQSGLMIDFSPQFNGMLMDNEISDSGRHGMEIADTTFTGMISGNRLVTNKVDGLNIDRTVFSGMISRNTIDQNEQTGIEIRAGEISAEISDNTIAGTFQGTLTPAEASRLFTIDDEGNLTISSNPEAQGNSGIFLFGNAADESTRIANNRISDFPYSGVNIQIPNLFDGIAPGSFFRGEISDNSFDHTIFGVLLYDFDDVLLTGGNVINNRFTENLFGISVSYFATNSVFTGDIRGNTFIDTERQSIDVRADNFTGNVSDNIVTFTGTLGDDGVDSGTTGIDINLGLFRTGTFTFRGDISGNRVSGVQSFVINPDTAPFEIVGDGIAFSATDFIGNVTNNVVTDNKGIGLAVSAFESFTGNFIGNRADRNGLRADGERGIAFLAKDFNGVVADNSASDNNGTGMQVDLLSVQGTINDNVASDNEGFGIVLNSATSLVGDVIRNTANNNGAPGIRIDASSFTGDISDNMTNGNSRLDDFGNDGLKMFLFEIAPGQSSLFTGNISGNESSNNSGVGISISSFGSGNAPRFIGNVSNNITNGNKTNGVRIDNLGSIVGTVSDNMIMNNVDEGLTVRVQGPDQNSTLTVRDNVLSGNNLMRELEFPDPFLAGREVLIENSGPDTLTITLEGNDSRNRSVDIPPQSPFFMTSPLDDPDSRPFNFDLRNDGSGSIILNSLNPAAPNMGTIGSSNDSVTIP